MVPADELKDTGAGCGAPSAIRRRLLRGGLAGGPVLMTIASRPVLGQTVCTASAMCSVIPVASLNHAQAHVCEEAAGLSPERWKAMAPDWPSPYIAVITPIVQDPLQASNCTTTAPSPAITQTTTAPTAYDSYRARRAELYASRGLTGPRPTSTVQAPTPTAPTTTTQVTCTTPAMASAPTTTQTTTAPGAYDAYRARRAELYASRGLTGLGTPSTTTSLAAPTTYSAPQPTPYAAPSSYPTTTAPQTTASSTTYTYRVRPGTRDPFFSGGTRTLATTPTQTSVPVATTTTPLVGPAGTNGTPFHCPTTGLNGQAFAELTMLDVLGASGGTYAALGRYTVAALLNAKSGRVHVLPESTVRNMWNDCVGRGWYEPAAGVKWGAAEVVAYMQKTIA